MEVKVNKIDGKNKSSHSLDLTFEGSKDSISHILYLVDKYQKAYLRQGTHATKTRSYVSGGGAKPYKQKGTGRARRGTSRSPLIRGGGVIFGPSPRDYSIKLNARLFKKAMTHVLSEKKEAISILSVENDAQLKTKDVEKYLTKQKIAKGDKVTFVLSDEDLVLYYASRNIENCIPFKANFLPVEELINSKHIVFSEKAMSELEGQLK